MEMTGEYQIPASPERVWEALNDAEILKACIPGCQSLEMISDTEMTATVVAKVGPVKATFTGTVTLSDLNPPESYTISGEGKGGVAGFAKGGADVNLTPTDDGTLLTYTAKAQVGGKLAQLGSRLVDATAKKMANEFFGKFAEILGGSDDEDAAEEGILERAEHVVADAAHLVEEVAGEAAHKAAESVKHAEEAVEQAAVKGSFGGAAMWGWIALAVVIVILFLVFR